MKMTDLKRAYQNNQLTKADYIVKMHDRHEAFFEYAAFLKDTDISRIEITEGQVVMTTRESGIRMICDPDDHRIAPLEILNFGHYEKEDCNMILRLIGDGFNVFDIGANFGWYSLNIAKLRRGRVFAFEPMPKTYEYLKKNIALNGLNSIEPFNFGFSDKEQALTFYYYPEGSGNASSVNLSGSEKIETISCPVKRLDDFVKEKGVAVDFIKCDVEGAELFVLRGSMGTLKKYKPVIFAELLRKWAAEFGYHPQEVVSLLKSQGYRCFIISEDRLAEISGIDDNTRETNFFFLHGEKHSSQISKFSVPG